MRSLITHSVFSLALFGLTACGLFSEEDLDVVAVAKQLLQEQRDSRGEPVKVDLPVRVNYTVSRKAMVDQELEVLFEFITERPIPVLRMGVTTSEGLELAGSNLRERYQDLKIREVITRRVLVVPTTENQFYLNLYLITEVGEDKRARLLAIPIAVGEYSLNSRPKNQ